VAGLAHEEVQAVAAEDEIVANAAHDGLAVRTRDQEVIALPAADQRKTTAALDDVVACVSMQEVHLADVCARIGDDVIAIAAMDVVNAVTTLETVIACPAPDGVVAIAGDDMVVAVRSLNDDMFAADISEVVDNAVVVRVETHHHRRQSLQE